MKGARETWPNVWREARETVDENEGDDDALLLFLFLLLMNHEVVK
jgi:hypothetical protein